MLTKSILHYRLEKRLGAGGMGEVYRARDTKLDRPVALKFLPESFRADAEARERLLQEARAASRLNHPNILTIYGVEEAEGRDFIVMEYVEGELLDQFVASRRDSLAVIVDLAIQIARGLAKAHQAGVIHRDLKPANILIDADRRVRILDFGLAKLEGAAGLTRTGSTLGTTGYLSPEQVSGHNVDPRSDIFSLGVVLYEMLTGRVPFQGEHEAAVIYALLNEEPPALADTRPAVPEQLARIVFKCLEKAPAARYQNAAQLIAELESLRHEPAGSAASATRLSSIAVLPFANMSADPEQEYFCDGIAEDITNDLCRLKDLSVAARTSAFAYKGQNIDVREIGKALNVETVLEGSVRKAGKRLRITAQLVTVANGYHAWSERYDRDLDDVFAIQDEIAQSIAGALEVQLSDHERRALQTTAPRDIAAYDLYLRARSLSRGSSRDRNLAVDLLQEALTIDPNYAPAHAGLAELYAGRYLYATGRREDIERATTHGRLALESDPQLAAAHSAYAMALALTEQWEDAEREFETAIRLQPNLYEAYYPYGRMCYVRGQLEKAAALFEKAANADPADYQALVLAANVHLGLKRTDRARDIALCALQKIEARLAQRPDDLRALSLGAGVLWGLGEAEKSRRWLKRALAAGPDDVGVLYNSACIYCRMEEFDKALEFLERARTAGFATREWLENDPDFDAIRHDPRFQSILAKVGPSSD